MPKMPSQTITDADLQRVVGRVGEIPDVVALYLSGSVASRQATPLSDVDFAVWLDPSSSSDHRFDVRLKLLQQVTRILGTDSVDLAVLNDAPTVTRYHLLRGSKRLYTSDHEQRIALEIQALKAYFDWFPSLRLHQQALKERIRSGRFAADE